GAISRPNAWWPSQYFAFDESKVGAGASFHVVHEAPTGELDGYVTYSIEHNWDNGIPRNVLGIRELTTATAPARRALSQYVSGVDLVETIRTWNSPADEALRWMLRESRRLRVTRLHDQLWLRFVDVAAALASRTYALEGELVIEVEDAFRPGAGGRFRLAGGPDGAECRRTSAEPDLCCRAPELASMFLGGVRPRELARAGLVEEAVDGALARADAMFAVDPLPYSQTWF
ncbi:MAG: sterol carrier protein domain-containing protein, partial [Actinobacteria bacterium]|nr:sterol carrier protein domain-containing protein [Actinomycetota bacterium]